MKAVPQEKTGMPLSSDITSFEQVFKSNFKALHGYASSFVKDSDTAEDIVQHVFVTLWEKSGTIQIQSSITAYLYRAVYHECLNHIKHMKVRSSHESYVKHQTTAEEAPVLEKLQEGELKKRLSMALSELPEGCRTVFQMSRFESLKYREIADRLDISVKTVENQMGKALRMLRTRLADYLALVLYLISILIKQ